MEILEQRLQSSEVSAKGKLCQQFLPEKKKKAFQKEMVSNSLCFNLELHKLIGYSEA